MFESILCVWFIWIMCLSTNTPIQIPHAFQQIMSHEKTPTLCHALPAFEAMTVKWAEHQDNFPETSRIVEKGLDKLLEYSACTQQVPAYVLAMGE
jgi:hypothetical protein